MSLLGMTVANLTTRYLSIADLKNIDSDQVDLDLFTLLDLMQAEEAGGRARYAICNSLHEAVDAGKNLRHWDTTLARWTETHEHGPVRQLLRRGVLYLALDAASPDHGVEPSGPRSLPDGSSPEAAPGRALSIDQERS